MDPRSANVSPSHAGQSDFATTQWSIVLEAGHRSSPQAERALEALCQAYWHPLYAYVRRRVPDIHEAHDLTQAFFAELLDKNYIRPASAERGRFRAYLLTCLKHFLAHQWEKAKAKKRGGGRAPLSLDFTATDSRLHIEPSTDETPEQFYDRQWAMALLERVLSRLKDQLIAEGKTNQFDILKEFLVGPPKGESYAAAAEALGTTTAAAKMAASRLRRRYRGLLRDEIAQTVSSTEQIEQEISDLFETLGGK